MILRNLYVTVREFRDVPAAVDSGEGDSDLNLATSVPRLFNITTDFAQRAAWLEPRE